MENLQEVGARVRAARVYRDLRVEVVAREVGMAPSSISRIESGDVAVKLEVLSKIASFLGVPLVTFTDGLTCAKAGASRITFSEEA